MNGTLTSAPRGQEPILGAPTPAPVTGILQPVGPHLVLAAPGAEDARLWSALGRLPAVADALTLLVATPNAAPALRQQLPALARTAAERGATTVVLAASGLAAAAPGARRPAEQIAAMTGLTVVAPDGTVSLEPDGTLVVGGEDASWWRCTADAEAERLGVSWPAWPPQRAAEGFALDLLRGAAWVRSATSEQDGLLRERLDALLLDGGPGEDLAVLVVGSPSQPTLPVDRLAAALRSCAPDASSARLSAPWATPVELAELALGLAVELGSDVRAAVGLWRGSAPGTQTAHVTPSVLLDGEGLPTWEPFLTELAASPRRLRVVPSAWRVSGGAWQPVTAAVFRHPAAPGWVLEAIPAGLWLRAEGCLAGCAPRRMRPDPRHPLLVVGDPDHPAPTFLWEYLGELLDGLPLSGEARLALLANHELSTDDSALARFAARSHRLGWVTPEGEVEREVDVEVEVEPEPEPVVFAGPPTPTLPTEPDEPSAAAEPLGPVEAAAPVATVAVVEPPVRVSTTAAAPVPSEPVVSEPVVAEPVELVGPAELPASPRAFTRADSVASPGASTAEDRERFKALLGPAFVRQANKADQIATRLPALRSTPADDIKADLVAVLLHQADTGVPAPRADVVAAARSGAPGPLTPFLACLGSGLRRLPSHHGAVLLGALASDSDVQHYTEGAVLVEPAPVTALPAYDVDLGALVEFAVWSTTGRRTALFAAPGEDACVVFPPGSRFRVLSVQPGTQPGTEPGTPHRILLREVGPVDEEPNPERERAVAQRLRSWLERRDAVAAHERRSVDRPERFHLTPGLALRV